MSIKKKIKSVITHGIKGIEEGIKNYKLNDPKIEALARERLSDILKNENNCIVDEPIDFMKVNDERIPELSGKMCDDCGCALPYLLRQNIKKCECWKK